MPADRVRANRHASAPSVHNRRGPSPEHKRHPLPPGLTTRRPPRKRLISTESCGKFALARPMAAGVENRASGGWSRCCTQVEHALAKVRGWKRLWCYSEKRAHLNIKGPITAAGGEHCLTRLAGKL